MNDFRKNDPGQKNIRELLVAFSSIVYSSLTKLEHYIASERFRGHDPYDALTSPVFNFPFFRSNKFVRLAAQQIGRKLPFNFRPFFAVPKGKNPVTLGLSIQAVGYLLEAFPDRRDELLGLGNKLVQEIEGVSTKGFSGHCWGYDFYWQARYGTIPAFFPTVVATGIVTNGLFEYHRHSKNEQALEMCKSASRFVLNDLYRTVEGETFCFSYFPGDKQVVYNATMKGARLLAQVYSVTGEKNLCEEAEKTVRFVVNNQRPDGSWTYSHGDSRTWVDNFHTGYILDCLDEFMKMIGRSEYKSYLEKGLAFYVNNFFVDKRIPKYYSNAVYPLDLTAGAQSILTLARFGHLKTAASVAVYLIEEMQDEEGFFYYRKGRFLKNKISYMRWSNAWMYAALSYLQLRIHDLV